MTREAVLPVPSPSEPVCAAWYKPGRRCALCGVTAPQPPPDEGRCPGCRAERPRGRVLCTPCWYAAPRELRAAWSAAGSVGEKRAAARRLIEWAKARAAALAVPPGGAR